MSIISSIAAAGGGGGIKAVERYSFGYLNKYGLNISSIDSVSPSSDNPSWGKVYDLSEMIGNGKINTYFNNKNSSYNLTDVQSAILTNVAVNYGSTSITVPYIKTTLNATASGYNYIFSGDTAFDEIIITLPENKFSNPDKMFVDAEFASLIDNDNDSDANGTASFMTRVTDDPLPKKFEITMYSMSYFTNVPVILLETAADKIRLLVGVSYITNYFNGAPKQYPITGSPIIGSVTISEFE